MGNRHSVGVVKATDQSDWMANLSPEKKSLPISCISILGSHDSFTYSLKQTFPVGPDEPSWMRTLAKMTGRLAKSVIARWARCQDLNCKDQLSLGVRYFDIRLAKLETKSEQSVRVIHGLYGDKIEDILQTLNEFLINHPGEIVILDFQHLYKFTESDHVGLVNLLKTIFDPSLLCPCPHENVVPSLQYLIENKQRVIVIYPFEVKQLDVDFLWPRDCCRNPWPNTVSTEVLETFLNQGLNVRNPDLLYVSQGILTPQAQTIIFNLFSSLMVFVEKNCNQHLRNWVVSKDTSNRNPNIVICDFPELFEVGASVIALNFD